ncbi:hypothetical protein L9F63_017256, partial [Diploptera punctata]
MEISLQPRTLFDLAIDSYVERIISFCYNIAESRSENKLYIAQECRLRLQSEISSLPALLREIVTNKIMNGVPAYTHQWLKPLGPEARTYALNIIIQQNIQSLHINLNKDPPCERAYFRHQHDYCIKLQTLNNLKIIRIGSYACFNEQVIFPVNLEEFSIPNCFITDAALENLAISCPKLKHLNIYNCAGITSNFINGISKCINLETLSMQFVKLLDADFMELLKLLKENKQHSPGNNVPTLKRLECGHLSSDHLHYLSENFPRLERLHMFYSEQTDLQTLSTISQIKQIGFTTHPPLRKFAFENFPQILDSKLLELHILALELMFTGNENHSWPMLKYLTLNFVDSELPYPRNCIKYESLSQFHAIETLEIIMPSKLHQAFQVFHYVISKCINLKTIWLKCLTYTAKLMYTSLIKLMDDIKTKELQHLEIIRMSPRPEGDHDLLAKKLIGVCPKLRVVV